MTTSFCKLFIKCYVIGLSRMVSIYLALLTIFALPIHANTCSYLTVYHPRNSSLPMPCPNERGRRCRTCFSCSRTSNCPSNAIGSMTGRLDDCTRACVKTGCTGFTFANRTCVLYKGSFTPNQSNLKSEVQTIDCVYAIYYVARSHCIKFRTARIDMDPIVFR